MPEIKVGVAAACLLGVAVLFQLALAVGAPWGTAAYGGQVAQDDGRLPTKYRTASAGTAVILTGALWWVLAASAVISPIPLSGNLAGRHPVERWGAGGITAVLTILCAWIAVTH